MKKANNAKSETQKRLGAVKTSSIEEESESTALAVRSNGDVDVPASVRKWQSAPQMSREDLALPKIKLGQPMTPEVVDEIAKAGQWIIPGEEGYDKLTFIPMVWGKGRILSDDDGIHCSSGDAIRGEGLPGGRCATCPQSQWSAPKKGQTKGTPPACTFYYSYGGYSPTLQSVVTFDLRKTAIKAALAFNGLINKRGTGKFAVELSSKKETNGKQTYYLPLINITKASAKEFETAAEEAVF